MSVVFRRDYPHVSYLVRTPAEKPGHDVLALPVSAFVQVPGVLPNFQPLFECEFERNAAASGAVLVLTVFLFPFAHTETLLARLKTPGHRRDKRARRRPPVRCPLGRMSDGDQFQQRGRQGQFGLEANEPVPVITDHDTLHADIREVAARDLDLGSDWKALYPFACCLVHF
jgi:hypothetical protein